MTPLRILTIVGARPQFIKAAIVSRAIERHNESAPGGVSVVEDIVHTGQHYDENMSQVFFEEMGIPDPAVNLNLGGGTHGEMTGKMMGAIEREIIHRQPDWVLVYGDTNSTLAAALAAAKLHVPVAHVEAGLRSHNARMPEEINRVLTDRISTVLFCPTRKSVENLEAEGYPHAVAAPHPQRVLQVGDVMYDVTLHCREQARATVNPATWGVEDGAYVLCTLHRAENTDSAHRLRQILTAIKTVGRQVPVLLPLHPRTRQKLSGILDDFLKASAAEAAAGKGGVQILNPLGYLEMQRLEMGASAILTDSGGVQKEAFFHGVPCITLREETEWVETVEMNANRLAGADTDSIVAAWEWSKTASIRDGVPYGDGDAGGKIVSALSMARQS